jgi:hypothetical protein
MIEYLILDYQREEEAFNLLKSIKELSNFPHKVTFLSNGGEKYALNFKKQELIDKLIINEENVGCGAGTIQLFAQCKSKYAFYIQVDHVLSAALNEDHINYMISLIEKDGNSYIDLSGDQGRGVYSERAQFMPVKFYNSIPKAIGGPGPWDDIEWTEKYVQDYIKDKNLKYKSLFFTNENGQKIPIFLDAGKWSFRSNPDGSQWKHRTDTKQLWMLKKPTNKFSFPRFSEEEWSDVLINGWADGKIPKNEIKHSFHYWK